MKKTMSFFCRITLMILAFVTGASSGCHDGRSIEPA